MLAERNNFGILDHHVKLDFWGRGLRSYACGEEWWWERGNVDGVSDTGDDRPEIC